MRRVGRNRYGNACRLFLLVLVAANCTTSSLTRTGLVQTGSFIDVSGGKVVAGRLANDAPSHDKWISDVASVPLADVGAEVFYSVLEELAVGGGFRTSLVGHIGVTLSLDARVWTSDRTFAPRYSILFGTRLHVAAYGTAKPDEADDAPTGWVVQTVPYLVFSCRFGLSEPVASIQAELSHFHRMEST